MDPITAFLLLSALLVTSVLGVAEYDAKNKAKDEAAAQQEQLLGDLDASLATEKEKLGLEYETTQTRLKETRDTVLGAQRQGFSVRGDVGGQDTAAAGVIKTTENRAQSDLDLLEEKYNLGLETLEQETQLAKDQLNWNFEQYIAGITAQQMDILGNVLTGGINALGALKLPGFGMKETPSLLDSGTGSLLDNASGWNPLTGYPT